jgi:predicted acyl esterase
MLTEQRPVGYFVMQAESWRFAARFPLDADRLTLALSATDDSASTTTTAAGAANGSQYVSQSLARRHWFVRL